MAIRIGYVNSSEALLRPSKHAQNPTAGAPFFKDWRPDVDNVAHKHGLLCAEMSRLAYADEPTTARSLDGAGFKRVRFIGGDDDPEAQKLGTQGFITESDDGRLTVLAFRGTESVSLADLVADAGVAQDSFAGAKVHRGFKSRYAPAQERVKELGKSHRGELLITGHSLGAALATLAAVEARAAARSIPAAVGVGPMALVTFGSPRVGNGDLGDLLRGIVVHRYVDCCDIVARAPPQRFDAGEVGRLLAELLNPDRFAALAVQAVAQLVAPLLAELLHDPRYEHVGELRYLDRHGTLVHDTTESTISGDQDEARREYADDLSGSATEHRPFGEPSELLKRLGDAVKGSGSAGVRKFFADFTNFDSAVVPLRDLADHAPINYVSALAGRLTTAQSLPAGPTAATPLPSTP